MLCSPFIFKSIGADRPTSTPYLLANIRAIQTNAESALSHFEQLLVKDPLVGKVPSKTQMLVEGFTPGCSLLGICRHSTTGPWEFTDSVHLSFVKRF